MLYGSFLNEPSHRSLKIAKTKSPGATRKQKSRKTFLKNLENSQRLTNKSLFVLSPFWWYIFLLLSINSTQASYLARMASVTWSIKRGSFLICKRSWTKSLGLIRSPVSVSSILLAPYDVRGRGPDVEDSTAAQAPGLFYPAAAPLAALSRLDRKGGRAGPSCLVNLFTSICSAAPTTQQPTKTWASCRWLQIGNLPVLFALGHKEGANSSFCTSSWWYSSLNYGCEKMERCKGPFPAQALHADPPRRSSHSLNSPPEVVQLCWELTIFSVFCQVFFFPQPSGDQVTWTPSI